MGKTQKLSSVTVNDFHVTGKQFSALRRGIPHKPDWFDRELALLASLEGQPFYRCINPQIELNIYANRSTLKYPFSHPNFGTHLRVVKQFFRRQNIKSRDWKYYKNKDEAKADADSSLNKLVDTYCTIQVEPIPRNCWVIEALVPPSEIRSTPEQWEALRWENVRGERMDLLGDFPKNGMYIHFMDVVNDEGEPFEPNRALLEILQKKFYLHTNDIRSQSQISIDNLRGYQANQQKQIDLINDAVLEAKAFDGKLFGDVEISKPITRIYAPDGNLARM